MIAFPVYERFSTFQGEGVYSGQPAFFIRLHGCPIHCPWCDSAGTWHPKYVPSSVPRLTVSQLVEEAVAARAEVVVITGGEPAVHKELGELVGGLKEVELRVHLETSGAFLVRAEFDWITLSPKKWKMPRREMVERASEFKVIVEEPDDISFYLVELLMSCPRGIRQPVWLHPEWSRRGDSRVMRAIASAVMARYCGMDVRAGYQVHKLYQVDQLDSRLMPLVPLGGDVDRGY